MSVPLRQQARVAAYIMKKRLQGQKRYPLVLMLEPLFQCNLECPGCGKIQYPKEILKQRLSAKECVEAAEECGAPVVSIPGGEPLIHKEIDTIVNELVKRKYYVYLCTNAMLLKKKLHLFEPSPYLNFSVHLDGLKDEHDRAVNQEGVFETATEAIQEATRRGFRCTVNATLFDDATAERVSEFLDYVSTLGIEGVTVSPGFAYEKAPDQENFLNRARTKTLFRDIFRRGKGKGWKLAQSSLFLDFLAGNQDYRCTPWSNPTRNVFGWQRPCYLLNEGYADSFKQLMEETDWALYGTGNYEKCANCMAHVGYEGTAVEDAVRNPLKALWVRLRGVKTEGPMAPEIPLDQARPAEDHLIDLIESEGVPAPDKSRDAGRTQEREPAQEAG
ncbi:hopanoid biosynthesis associated radical SAM protein HpnH [Limimonas halophila]|uniref:Hopanoid biosynthesis associated radical SAM protein HpnH n=1 Tax=Limimonas halophila TaxID=1082479 RepID=A0A1G7P467_9PROT|nr:adenosyl-hopene transferase HpnH [Limimonas halophila]SDF81053.1 hopanoid biosynthesis associated radical SAM protein HpnH [Limimonas halophila]